MVKKNPCLTATQIATGIHEKFNKNILEDTARKILKKGGYRSPVVPRKPYTSMTNQLKRIAFAKDHIHKDIPLPYTYLWSSGGL
ncbi:hypothetical protein TNCV_1453291 [Trichonephila clavipes]|nr:hypothetical protein TNCV_1453291 [Trichonephila clavipes]